MRKAAAVVAVISILIFVFAWGIGGVMIYKNSYESSAWMYVGLGAAVIFFCSLIFLKTRRCPACDRLSPSFGEYCPYCGKKIQ